MELNNIPKGGTEGVKETVGMKLINITEGWDRRHGSNIWNRVDYYNIRLD